MNFHSEKEVKTAVSGIRRELKALGVTSVSHAQMLEVVARGLGFSSYGGLLNTVGIIAQPEPLPAGRSFTDALARKQGFEDYNALLDSVDLVPEIKETYKGEARVLAEMRKYVSYRLRNDAGQLDLSGMREGRSSDSRMAVDGLYLESAVQGITELVPGLVRGDSMRRDKGGPLAIFDGRTDIDWDAQYSKKDSRGQKLWLGSDDKPIPEDRLVLIPEFCDSLNLVSEDVLVDEEITLDIRESLVATAQRWLVDNSAVPEALVELAVDDDGRFEEGFVEVAEAFYPPGHQRGTVLGSMQWVLGFALHVYELKELRQRLLAH